VDLDSQLAEIIGPASPAVAVGRHPGTARFETGPPADGDHAYSTLLQAGGKTIPAAPRKSSKASDPDADTLVASLAPECLRARRAGVLPVTHTPASIRKGNWHMHYRKRP